MTTKPVWKKETVIQYYIATILGLMLGIILPFLFSILVYCNFPSLILFVFVTNIILIVLVRVFIIKNNMPLAPVCYTFISYIIHIIIRNRRLLYMR
jgi:hypothetical protein